MTRLDQRIRAGTQDAVVDAFPSEAFRAHRPMNRWIERLDRLRVTLLSVLADSLESDGGTDAVG